MTPPPSRRRWLAFAALDVAALAMGWDHFYRDTPGRRDERRLKVIEAEVAALAEEYRRAAERDGQFAVTTTDSTARIHRLNAGCGRSSPATPGGRPGTGTGG